MITLRHKAALTGTTALVLLTAFALISECIAGSQPPAQTAPAIAKTLQATAGLNALPAGLMPIVAQTLAVRSPEVWDAHITAKHEVLFNNPAQHLAARFDAGALHLQFNGKQPAQLRMQLRTLQSGTTSYAVAPAELTVKGNRVALAYDHGLDEWYVNSPLGLEQGFTLAKPLAATSSLTLALKLAGNLTPKLNGQSIDFLNAKGQSLLRYAKLLAYDANHRSLPAKLALNGRILMLSVNTQDAQFPVTVDPLFTGPTTFNDPAASASDSFGIAVALSGDGSTALIGASGTTVQGKIMAGAAYLFTSSNGIWSTTPAQKYYDPQPVAYDQFGASVALSADGSTALIGAPDATIAGRGAAGAVYAYAQSNGTWSATPAQTFDDQGTGAGDLFGSAVALSTDGNIALIGGSHIALTGRAYIFARSNGTWSTTYTQSFNDPGVTAGDGFGASVALSADGTVVLAGAAGTTVSGRSNAGAAYVYTLGNGTWSAPQTLTAATGTFFGNSVSLSADGSTALIGAYASLVSGKGLVGTAYLFARSNGTWPNTPVHTFNDPAAGAGDQFGYNVSLSADASTALIGANGTAVSAKSGAGAAYAYVQSNGTWPATPTQTFTEPTAGANNGFGSSVVLSADESTALIGAYQENHYTGVAYAYAGPAAPTVDLALALASNPASVTVNNNVTYMLTVTNNSSQTTSTGLSLIDTLPANMTYVSTTAAGGSCTNSSGTVTCTLASLAPQATWQPSITVTATSAGSITNSASVSGNQSDPNTTNNTATVTTTVNAAGGGGGGGSGGSGGGGALDALTLVVLLGLILTRRRWIVVDGSNGRHAG